MSTEKTNYYSDILDSKLILKWKKDKNREVILKEKLEDLSIEYDILL